MYQALIWDAHGDPNQIVYWSRLLDGKNQTLTAGYMNNVRPVAAS